MALYEICGGKNASQVGRASQRNPQTVMEGVHRDNDEGSYPAALDTEAFSGWGEDDV